MGSVHHHTVSLVKLRDRQVDNTNLSKVLQLLQWLSMNRVASCHYTGRLEDTELHQGLKCELLNKNCWEK